MSNHQKEALEGICDERKYQEILKKQGRFKSFKNTVAEYLTVMHAYMHKAMLIWPETDGDEPTLHQIRKLTALGMACLEHNGCPPRVLPNQGHEEQQQTFERTPTMYDALCMPHVYCETCVCGDCQRHKQSLRRPPLGIMPRYIWIDKRKEDLINAINRYMAAQQDVPKEWLTELASLQGIGDIHSGGITLKVRPSDGRPVLTVGDKEAPDGTGKQVLISVDLVAQWLHEIWHFTRKWCRAGLDEEKTDRQLPESH